MADEKIEIPVDNLDQNTTGIIKRPRGRPRKPKIPEPPKLPKYRVTFKGKVYECLSQREAAKITGVKPDIIYRILRGLVLFTDKKSEHLKDIKIERIGPKIESGQNRVLFESDTEETPEGTPEDEKKEDRYVEIKVDQLNALIDLVATLKTQK